MTPDYAQTWLELGRTLHELKRRAEAAAFVEATKGGPQRATALFNLACADARSGEREKGIDAAAQSVEAGFRTKYFYQDDEDLAAVREDPRVKALLAKL